MKTILKYLAIFAALIVPALFFPERVSLILLEYSLTVVVVSSIVVSQWIWWVKSDYRQYTTWLVSLLVGLLPWALNFGLFRPLFFPELVVYALLVGLISNGLYDLSWIKKILTWIGVLKPAPSS